MFENHRAFGGLLGPVAAFAGAFLLVATACSSSATSTPQAPPAQARNPEYSTIIITTDRHMRDVTADARAAIEEANNSTPFFFVRSGLPTRVEIDENGNVIAKPLTASAMRGIMERTANFMSENSIEGEPIQKPVNPPFDIVNDFLSLGSYPDLPPLIGVSTAPIVAPDGTICSDVGYQPKPATFITKARNWKSVTQRRHQRTSKRRKI